MPACVNAANGPNMRNLLEEEEGKVLVHRAEIRAPMTCRLCGTAEPCAAIKNMGFL